MLKIDCQRVIRRITKFIGQTLREAGFKKTIIALSGGIDSSTTTTLAVRGLGAKGVLVALLPYGDLNKLGVKHAKLLMEKLAIRDENIFQIDIKQAVDTIVSADKKMSKLRKGNIMARVRMVYLYDLAKKNRALVCGTENRTEYLLGYFTRFGDEASDIEPLRGLYKTQVIKLANYLGVPQKIIEKEPSAGLWEGQTDEREFDFSYRDADQILHLYYGEKKKENEIMRQGFDRSVVEKVLKWAREKSFKHKTPSVLDL